jgi:hypothetical protein
MDEVHVSVEFGREAATLGFKSQNFHAFSFIPSEIRSFRKHPTLYYGSANISTLFLKNKSCKIAENPRDYLQK